MDATNLPRVSIDDFSRRFGLRAPNLMWFLGAGASASAGIPTAGDMIWEFKQRLYISQRRVSAQRVADLSNAGICSQLQTHIDSCGCYPPSGATDEYAALFEGAYPSELDRRAYIDAKQKGAKPSFGHLALATLMRSGLARILWTTNFDALVADACAKIFDSTSSLTTVALDCPELAAQLINEQRWPVEVKLHGDFRSRRLKNTNDELRLQDAQLRRVLLESCRRFGLVVVGYSGRDDSVMESLEEALKVSGAFPAGLFWLHRGEGAPLLRVSQFVTRAAAQGIEAALVAIENFDETLRDLLRLVDRVDTRSLDSFYLERRRWSAAPRPVGRGGWPVIRLNALPILQTPSVCRRVVCNVGGYREVRKAVEQANVDVLVARTRAGVLAFGSDAALRAAFGPFDISDFSLHTIDTRRLRYESGERGLLRDALRRAIVRHRGLGAFRRRSCDLLAPTDPESPVWTDLRELVGAASGTVKNHPELRWREGIATRLDWADDRLLLVFEPRTVFDGITPENKAAATDFARERTAKRFNRQLNALVGFWSTQLAGDGSSLRALGVGDGVDAEFRLSGVTCYSRRAKP